MEETIETKIKILWKTISQYLETNSEINSGSIEVLSLGDKLDLLEYLKEEIEDLIKDIYKMYPN